MTLKIFAKFQQLSMRKTSAKLNLVELTTVLLKQTQRLTLYGKCAFTERSNIPDAPAPLVDTITHLQHNATKISLQI